MDVHFNDHTLIYKQGLEKEKKEPFLVLVMQPTHISNFSFVSYQNKCLITVASKHAYDPDRAGEQEKKHIRLVVYSLDAPGH